METGPWGTRWFRVVFERLVWDLYGDGFCLCLLLLHRNLSFYLVSLLTLEKIGHLKLHTVGDVNLSHSLGIDFGCAGYESDFDNNIDRWYD
jgi:hypothetical protein